VLFHFCIRGGRDEADLTRCATLDGAGDGNAAEHLLDTFRDYCSTDDNLVDIINHLQFLHRGATHHHIPTSLRPRPPNIILHQHSLPNRLLRLSRHSRRRLLPNRPRLPDHILSPTGILDDPCQYKRSHHRRPCLRGAGFYNRILCDGLVLVWEGGRCGCRLLPERVRVRDG
jgi:hypothetical protein